MTREDLLAIFTEELRRIAPDLEGEPIPPGAHLQDDLDLDSMDVVALVAALHARLGTQIPEADYRNLATPAQAADYLAARLG